MKQSFFLFILTLLVLPLTAVRAQQPADQHQLYLQTTTFDPLVDGEPVSTLAVAAQSDGPAYYIIQFAGPIQEAWTQQVEQLGASLLGYIPDNAHVARIRPADLPKIRSVDAVRWVGPYQPAYKRSPRFDSGASLASAGGQTIALVAFPGESAAAIAAQVQALGATIDEATDTPIGPIVRATVPGSVLPQLTQIPGVSWVEPYLAPRLADAEARKIMNADSIWQSNTLYGKGQIVAISDSGLSVQGALSTDFEGRLLRAYAPSEMRPDSPTCRAKNTWTDLNGHGTHVAGSVLGNGRNGGSNPAARQFAGTNAGVAPEASMIFMAMNTDGQGALQCIPTNGNYIAFGYQNGARISSNSWGSDTGGVYTANDSVIDDYIWRNRDYLVLFAAGNSGPEPSTVGSPGSAKNILSVGASENFRPDVGARRPINGENISDNPTDMAFFSSRGPTADGRVKPDIVAPGTNIISVLGAQAQSLEPIAPGQPYAYSSGTSMATPLTAGAAALLREWLATQRGVSNPSAALQKALLIHGAAPMPVGPVPNMNSGWGRVDLKNTIGARYALFEDNVQGLRSGQVLSYTIQVAGAAQAGTLFVQSTAPGAEAVKTLTLVNDALVASSAVPTVDDPGALALQAIPGYDATHNGPRIQTQDRRAELVPSRQFPLHIDPRLAAPLPAPSSDAPALQNFQQGMVGGGDFEDPGWTNTWSEIWLGEGRPVRTSRGQGLVLAGEHSVLLGGSATDDTIYYPVSFPRSIANDLPSRLSFLLQMQDLDRGFDFFCVTITDASGNIISPEASPIAYCSDEEAAGVTQQIEITLNTVQKQALAGQTGYLALLTFGDAQEPHMAAFVDNIDLKLDFPNVTLSPTPGSGPAGTRFLLAGSFNVPYGPVDVCASSCANAANKLGTVFADDRGDIRAYLTISTTAQPGNYAVQTRNVAGRSANTTITILDATPATLVVEPAVGPAGTTFSFAGTRFAPHGSEIAVAVNGTNFGTVGSDANGAVSFRLNTTSNTPPGSYQVRLTDQANRQADVTFQVTGGSAGNPTMQVEPGAGPPGTAFRFTGSGFAPQAAISFTLDGQAIGSSSSDANGGFAVTLNTNAQIVPGSYTLAATQGEQRASAQFQITGGGGGGPTPTPSGNGIYVTLVWTDPPAQAAASRALVNDLNLRMVGPGGTSYRGNGGQEADSVNNVETIRLEQPAPGTYIVYVEAARVNATFGEQPFALLATTGQNYGANAGNAGVSAPPTKRQVFLPFVRR